MVKRYAKAMTSEVESPAHALDFHRYAIQISAAAGAELQKIWHDPLDIFTHSVQPALWILVFGEVMAQARGISSGSLPYIDFLAAGILAQSVLFVSIFYGISAIWERDLGVIQRYLVSPAPRSALVIVKALAASVRALIQASIVYVLALILDIDISLAPLNILGAIGVIALGSEVFSTFSLIIACIVKTRERFMGRGSVRC